MRDTRLERAPLNEEIEAVRADADLVDAALAASGDTHAYERLYRNHVSRIHSLARRMINPDVADEVTQDVFVRAWEKLSTFRGEAAFGTWLHRLAINVILGRRATLGIQRDRYQDGEDTFDQLPTRPVTPELGIDFESAIGKLPKGARQIFVLHDVEGFKHEEIAENLGISVGTSKAQLHRARMMLRRHLTR
jgi:RNA polymerase sigma-70 factor (ECF subfamily)